MTFPVLNGCLEQIDIRKHNELAVKVNLAGGKMDFKTKEKQIETSEEDRKIMAKRIKEAEKRKVEEMRLKRQKRK